jgi:uncharacterized protein (TIGR03083 family)
MNTTPPPTNERHGAGWRKETLARLAAERAYFLLQYHSLSEDSLTNVPVVGDMTFKDVLLHMAAWDAAYTERFTLVSNGRSADLHLLAKADLDQHNNALTQSFQHVPLEQALAACLKERAGFLAALNRMPDALLHKRLTLPNGERIRPRTWLRRRFLHDMNHAAELALWRSSQSSRIIYQIGPKPVLRAIIQATRKEFLTLVDLIPEAERTTKPVCGVWTIKDLAGHLTDWERVGVDGLRQLAAGQTPEFDYEIPDFDAFNNKNAAARAHQSWDEGWADFTSTRQELTSLFDELPETALTRMMPTPWGRTMPAYAWMLVWAGHEHEHAIDVRRALNPRHWPRRLRG